MLERLDAVDWANLRHAYGPAVDVPEYLRALLLEDTAQRMEAIADLFSTIWHQGTVYQATAYAVPFLLELAASKPVADRLHILDLLRVIADGKSGLAVHADSRNLRSEPDFETRLAKELVWVQAARDAVREGIPLYLSLLADSSPKIVTVAGYVLLQFREEIAPYLPSIRQQYENTSDLLLRAALLHCLANIGGTDETTISLLETLANDYDQPLLLRFIAAVGLTENAPAHCSPITIDLLQDISKLHQSDRRLEEYNALIPDEESASDAAKQAIRILDRLAQERRSQGSLT